MVLTWGAALWIAALPLRAAVASEPAGALNAASDPVLSGSVRTARTSAPLNGIVVRADAGGGSAVTDAHGVYSLTVPLYWTGTVTPVSPDYRSLTGSRSYVDVTADGTNEDFTVAFEPDATRATPTLQFESPIMRDLIDGTEVSIALRAQGDYRAQTLSVQLDGQAVPLLEDPTDTGPGTLYSGRVSPLAEGSHQLVAEVESDQPTSRQRCGDAKKKAIARDLRCRLRLAAKALGAGASSGPYTKATPASEDVCTKRLEKSFRRTKHRYKACTSVDDLAERIQDNQQVVSEHLAAFGVDPAEASTASKRCTRMRIAAVTRDLQCKMKARFLQDRGHDVRRFRRRCEKRIERSWARSARRWKDACPVAANVADRIASNREASTAVHNETESVGARIDFDSATFSPNVDCDPLNNANCLLPWPSVHFLEEVGKDSETGYRMKLPVEGALQLYGAPLQPEAWQSFDGFSPMAQILMSFDARVDLKASKAPVLLDARCCGQFQQAPLERVRTIDETSLSPESPTLLIDLETGEQLAHFIEVDARATESEEQILFMRPAESLLYGRHYAVAVRQLVDTDGNPIPGPPAFRAILENRPTQIPGIEARRIQTQQLLEKLETHGIDTKALSLAFSFVTRSREQSTQDLVSMTAQTLQWIDENPLSVNLNEAFNQAPENYNPDCKETGEAVGWRIKGTFGSPWFLAPISFFPGVAFYISSQRLARDGEGTPRITGVFNAPFDIAIPCNVLVGETPPRNLLLGHGLFGTGASIVDSIADLGQTGRDLGVEGLDYIATATDFRGLSSPDLIFVGFSVIGSGTHQLNNFPALVARIQQAVANNIALGRILKSGRLNEIAAFQRQPGDPSTGYFPMAEEPLRYYGISYGGVMGLLYGALTPDANPMVIDVGAANFALMLPRSTQFGPFDALLADVGVTEAMEAAILLGLIHEQWLPAEPAGFLRTITGEKEDVLPGSVPKKIFMTHAWLDQQVSDIASEITVRSLGIPNVAGSFVSNLVGIEDVPAPSPSGYSVVNTGSFNVFNEDDDPYIPRLANRIPNDACDPHNQKPSIPAVLQQLADFAKKDGMVTNPCSDDGVCNASSPYERSGGSETVCNPVPGEPPFVPAPPPPEAD